MLVYRLQHYPTLAQYWVTGGGRVVYGVTLNVGHRHKWRASINPALVQSIVLVQSMLHKPTIDPAIFNAGPTFNRDWIGVSLYSVDTPPPTENTVQCWMVDGQSRRRWTSVNPALVWRVVFARHCVVDQLAVDTGPLSYPGVFTQCCFNVGPPSSPLAQHLNSIGWMTLVCWDISYQPFSCRSGDISSLCLQKLRIFQLYLCYASMQQYRTSVAGKS